MNAVLSLSAISISNYQYTLSVSKAEKTVDASSKSAFVHARYRVSVPLGCCVKTKIVDAKSKSSDFLEDRYSRCKPLPLCRLDEIPSNHLINSSFFKFARFWSSLVGCRVYWACVLLLYFDGALCHCDAAKIIVDVGRSSHINLI